MTLTETLEEKQKRLEEELQEQGEKLQEQSEKINEIFNVIKDIQLTVKELVNPVITVQNGDIKEMRLYSVIGGLYKNSHEHSQKIASIEESLKSFRKVTIKEDDGSSPTFELDDIINKLWHRPKTNLSKLAIFSDNFVKIFTGVQTIALIIIGVIYFLSKKG